MNPQFWEDYYQASRDIWINRTKASQFLLTLLLKQNGLKAKGLENKPKTSDSLTGEELYAPKCLGCESRQAIINTLLLNSTLHSSLRGGKLTERVTLGRYQTQANARRKRVFAVLWGFYATKRKLHCRWEIRKFLLWCWKYFTSERSDFWTLARPCNIPSIEATHSQNTETHLDQKNSYRKFHFCFFSFDFILIMVL